MHVQTSSSCSYFSFFMSVFQAGVFLVVLGLAGPVMAQSDLAALVQSARAAGEGADDLAPLTLTELPLQRQRRDEGALDFPFSVGIDLPLAAAPRDLSLALTGPVETTGRFVLVFDVTLAKVSRQVRALREQASRKIVSLNRIDNPAYQRAVKLLDSASLRLERRPGDPLLLARYEEAQRKAMTTPQALEQPVYGSYLFRVAEIEGTKTLTVRYHLIDRGTQTMVSSVFDVVERESFSVAYDLDPSDPAQASLMESFVPERRVVDWERAPVVVPLSRLLDQSLAAGGPTRPTGSLANLLAGFARDRTDSLTRAAAGIYDSRPLADPRFDSVVAVYTAKGLGSGFFVRPDIVMTNAHVVRDSTIIALRTYDRRETFGQVIARDPRLDLALIKVQDRGRPVVFATGTSLAPGERVDVIGHPQAQLFSITRGVVSAVRSRKPDLDQTSGGPEVLYVQTDAAINPGNSGGPLFVGEKVVGVATFTATMPAGGAGGATVSVPMPGLNFAIHYAEARRFLEQAMRGE